MNKISLKKPGAILVSLSLGIILGLVLTVPAAANASEKNSSSAPSSTTVETASQAEPDLIPAIGIGGTKGYVKSSDLMGNIAKTPEEAVAKMHKKELMSQTALQIPLYAKDGKTVIGKFQMSRGKVTLTKADETTEKIHGESP